MDFKNEIYQFYLGKIQLTKCFSTISFRLLSDFLFHLLDAIRNFSLFYIQDKENPLKTRKQNSKEKFFIFYVSWLRAAKEWMKKMENVFC